MAQNYQYGGWYNNPAAGGKNMRWFNGVWTNGEEPGKSSNSSSGGGAPAATGSGQKSISIPPFTFDWNAAENDALQKLAPYYAQKLKEANGDVDLAKSRLEEDYKTGARQNAEDLATQTQQDTQNATEETNTTREDLNKRGLLFGSIPAGQDTTSAEPQSQFATEQVMNPLVDKQQARRLAIQRALQRKDEEAKTTLQRGEQDQDIGLTKYKTAADQEMHEKATLQMAPLSYQRAYDKYQATVNQAANPYLQ